MWVDIWQEISRYVYFVVTFFILIPIKNKWDKSKVDKENLVKKVDLLEQEIGKVKENQDDHCKRFNKIDLKLDENRDRSDIKNEEVLKYLSKIDKQTAVNTAKLEDSK